MTLPARAVALTGALVVCVGLLSGCGGGEESATPEASASSAEAAGGHSSEEGPAEEAPAEEAPAEEAPAEEAPAEEAPAEEASADEHATEEGAPAGEHAAEEQAGDATQPEADAGSSESESGTAPQGAVVMAEEDPAARAGLPADFPETVPVPAGVKLAAVDTFGAGEMRAWHSMYKAASWKQACVSYQEKLTAAGFREMIAGESGSGSGALLRGPSHDVLVTCGAGVLELVVNPSQA